VCKRTVNQILAAAIYAAMLTSGAMAQGGQYTAVLNDGKRVSGDRLTGWDRADGTVRLGDEVIKAPGKPLRWIRNASLRLWDADEYKGGYVEFVGGDRITGNVVGGQAEAGADGMYVPAHLVLHPATSKRQYTHGTSVETVRLLPGSIRRVVLAAESRMPFKAGTVFYRDGRRVIFERIRWRAEDVQILLKAGSRTIRFSDIAEIHMPPADTWDAYYRELAVLSPDCRSRLIRIETNDGLIATGSESRFGAIPYFSENTLRKANDRRRQYDQAIARLEKQESQRIERVKRYNQTQEKLLATIESGIKREAEQHRKAVQEAIPKLEKQRKELPARYAAELKKIDDDYKKAVQDVEKRVARLPENQRASKRRLFLSTKKRSMERLRSGLVTRRRSEESRLKLSLEKLKRDQERNLQSIASAKEKLKVARERVKSYHMQHDRYAKELEHYRKLRDALPGPNGGPETWYHMVQPAWSLEPLWVPFKTIRMRWSFPPDAIPLSRLRPDKTVSPMMLKWRADRNTDGGQLHSGGLVAGWGFGVHAHSELSFTLPNTAVSFRSRLGLDRFVDTGGCVRARVFLGSIAEKPVYQSPLIIGSDKTADTGSIRLSAKSQEPLKLILQVDPVDRDHPPNADPLNIRDKFDWLEPQINLDPGRLRGEVFRHMSLCRSVWRDWTVSQDPGGRYEWGNWMDRSARYERGIFLPLVSAKGKPLKLSREMRIPADHQWLIVDVGAGDLKNIDPKAISLRVGGKDIPAEKPPVRQWWRRRTVPLVFAIRQHAGKNVKLELTQRPDGERLYWRAIATSNSTPGAYKLKSVLEACGKGDMQVPRGLGLTLQSSRLKKSYVLEALEVARLGGKVTFCNEATGQFRYEYLYGAMIGCDWKGGDKGFEKLKDLRWLRLLVLAKDSGVSDGAIARLKAAKGEDFVIRQVHRTPSAWGGMSCTVTVRNRTKGEILVARVHGWGGLTDHRRLKPGVELEMHAHEGYRYEAHVQPGDYNKSKPISRTGVYGDTVWEVK